MVDNDNHEAQAKRRDGRQWMEKWVVGDQCFHFKTMREGVVVEVDPPPGRFMTISFKEKREGFDVELRRKAAFVKTSMR